MSLTSPHTQRTADRNDAPGGSAADRQNPQEAHLSSLPPLVHRYLTALVARDYEGRHAALSAFVGTLVEQGRHDPEEIALPLLVHAAITGEAEPAVPIAAVHALWWRSANAFDDVADDEDGPQMYGMNRGAAVTAALECGYALPLRALATLPVPETLQRALATDYLDGWTTACDGQIRDILNQPDQVSTEAVHEVYRKKSGAIYAMACAMSARLAHGTSALEDDRIAQQVASWREFGETLGILAQFRNDHDDLRDGPGSDLRNGTATYLLVHLLNGASGAPREHALRLLDQAATSPPHRRELAALLVTPEVLHPYNALLGRLRDHAHALLDALAPASWFTAPLRARVDTNARPLNA